jgi:hypothetical protein
MRNAKRIGCLWGLVVAAGIGLAVVNTPAVALASPGETGKGPASGQSSHSSDTPSGKKSASPAPNDKSDTPKPRHHPPKRPVVKVRADSKPSAPLHTAAALSLVTSVRRETEPSAKVAAPATPTVSTSAADPDFITSTHGFFGLFSVTSAADPDDNHYVAFVLRTPFFTNVLTSGTDPEDNLGFGAASIGVAGSTVNTFMSPFLNFSIGIPVEDPFAELFTALVRAGF